MKKIKEIRLERGITQIQMGKYLNMTQQAVSEIENNRNDIYLSTAKKIADYFDVKIDDLIE